MTDNDTQIIAHEGDHDIENMSNEDMENFFKEAQAEEANLNQPTDEGTNDEGLLSRSDVQGSEQSGRRTEQDAESSSEDGREEHQNQQMQDDEPAERSEERREVLSDEERSYKAAMREERELRRQLQQELAEQREAARKMSEAVSKLVDPDSPSEQSPQIPSYDEDPLGNLNAKLELANKKIESLSKADEQMMASQKQQQEFNDFMGKYRDQATQFASQTPDFVEAYAHLVKEVQADYMAQGLTAHEAQQAALNMEIDIAKRQMGRNENPAKVLYDMAKRRGYQGQAAEKAPQPSGKKTPVDLDRMERGVKASRSINSKGIDQNNRMTLEEISELDDDAFEDAWDKVLQMG